MNQISLFEAKVANGNGEQTLSRDVYRLGRRFDFFQLGLLLVLPMVMEIGLERGFRTALGLERGFHIVGMGPCYWKIFTNSSFFTTNYCNSC
ncbi:hypothetical protein CsSME_00054044 [Camellia sinensis var. sinensis]